MASLSREEMARLTGGDFTVYDCKEGNDGKYCAISFSGDTVTLGICKVSYTDIGRHINKLINVS